MLLVLDSLDLAVVHTGWSERSKPGLGDNGILNSFWFRGLAILIELRRCSTSYHRPPGIPNSASSVQGIHGIRLSLSRHTFLMLRHHLRFLGILWLVHALICWTSVMKDWACQVFPIYSKHRSRILCGMNGTPLASNDQACDINILQDLGLDRWQHWCINPRHESATEIIVLHYHLWLFCFPALITPARLIFPACLS